MNLSDSTPVVTGAARGLGRHLVDQLLDHGVARVYALARDPQQVRRDSRIVPIRFDLLDTASIDDAARHATDATLLINNASTAIFAPPLDAETTSIAREMDVNYRGTYSIIRAFVPLLVANGGGHIVNVLSLLSLAPTPRMTGYSASKAAAHSLTQALRPALAAQGVSVHGVYPGGIDTDMLAGVEADKAAPELVAMRIIAALAAEETVVFPDDASAGAGAVYLQDPLKLEQMLLAS